MSAAYAYLKIYIVTDSGYEYETEYPAISNAQWADLCRVLDAGVQIEPLQAELATLREQLAAAQVSKPVAHPDIPDGALGQNEPFRSVGLKWIQYARNTYDANDIAVAVWSAMKEAITEAREDAFYEAQRIALKQAEKWRIERPEDEENREAGIYASDAIAVEIGELIAADELRALPAEPQAAEQPAQDDGSKGGV
jgi:hypothetical protein